MNMLPNFTLVSLFARFMGAASCLCCLSLIGGSALGMTIDIGGSAASAALGGGSTSGTITGFTVPNLDNRALVVVIGGEVTEGVSSVTYGSQSLVEAGTAVYGGNTMSSIWYLFDPLPTTANITVNRTAGGNGWAFGALNLSNVAQQAPVTGTFSAGNSANPSVSLNILDNNSLVIEALGRNETGTNTPLSGQSPFVSVLTMTGGAGMIGSTDLIPTAGLTLQEWAITASSRTTLVAAAFSPIIPPAPEPSSLLLLGLGAWGLSRQTRGRRAGASPAAT